MAWIYGIQSGLFIKIGIANDIRARLNIMNLYNPHPCKIVVRRRVTEARWVEMRMHEALKPYALGREWFAADVTLVRSALTVILRQLAKKRNDQILWQAECERKAQDRKTRKLSKSSNCGRDVDLWKSLAPSMG